LQEIPWLPKRLKEKRVSAEVKLMIRNIEDLHKIWSMLGVCYELPEKKYHGSIITFCDLQEVQGF
jgi:hypothetical protein